MQTQTACLVRAVHLLLLILLLQENVQSQKNNTTPKPVPIIFDTDMGPDYDDIGAIALLHAMADKGECTLLATIASNKSRYIAATLNVMNTYYKRPNLPVGVVQGEAVSMEAPQKWDSMLVADYPHHIQSNDQAEDALLLYRKLLASQKDHSVTIVTVGFLTNMAKLLSSPPDQYSRLTGLELVRKKVKQLVCMAGCFNEEMGRFKEFNVVKDTRASVKVFTAWPTPILFSGFEIGAKIYTGLPIAFSDLQQSPVKDVFKRSIPMDPNDRKGRNSWDETAVLVAVRGYTKYFSSIKGTIIPHLDGSNGWDTKGNRDSYLVQKMPIPEIEKIINDLMMHQPGK